MREGATASLPSQYPAPFPAPCALLLSLDNALPFLVPVKLVPIRPQYRSETISNASLLAGSSNAPPPPAEPLVVEDVDVWDMIFHRRRDIGFVRTGVVVGAAAAILLIC